MKNPCPKHDDEHEWRNCPDNFWNKMKSKKKKKDKDKQNQINKESNYSKSSSDKDYNLSSNKSEGEKKSKRMNCSALRYLWAYLGPSQYSSDWSIWERPERSSANNWPISVQGRLKGQTKVDNTRRSVCNNQAEER
eukprot:13232216-Ditylum_brightwellii.AAC.1